jgi:hypothetical protein
MNKYISYGCKTASRMVGVIILLATGLLFPQVNTAKHNYPDSFLITFSIENKNNFQPAIFNKRLASFGKVSFSDINASNCKSTAIFRPFSRLDSSRIQVMKNLFESKGIFQMYGLATPNEIKKLINKTNARFIFGNSESPVSDINDLFIAYGEHIGVLKKNVDILTSLISRLKLVNAFSADSIQYDILFDHSFAALQTLPSKPPDDNSNADDESMVKIIYFVKYPSIINNSDVDSAKAYIDKQNDHFTRIFLTSSGKERLAEFVKHNSSYYAAVGIDNIVYSCPMISRQYADGPIDIAGLTTVENLTLRNILNQGILETPISICTFNKMQ